MIHVSNASHVAASLLAGSDTDIVGTAYHGKGSAEFSFVGVAADPRKGDDGLAIVLVIASLEHDRATFVAATPVPDRPDCAAIIAAGGSWDDAQDALKDHADSVRAIRKEAGEEWDNTIDGDALASLRDRYASAKRATFRLPGTSTYATLSAVIGKVTAKNAAGRFAKKAVTGK